MMIVVGLIAIAFNIALLTYAIHCLNENVINIKHILEKAGE
jgi:hypothetical protein